MPEEKGLGGAVTEISISGGKKVHRRYAKVIPVDGGYNVEVRNFVTQKPVYLLEKPVSEGEAQSKLDELK